MNKIFIFSILFCIEAGAQDPQLYNEIYKKTYLETSQKDFKKAVSTADSLFTVSETPFFKAKSLMLTATLYQNSGDLQKSVDYALRSENIINQTDHVLWQAKIAGFLATQYRILKLYGESQKHATKGIEISKGIKDPEAANSTAGLMSQEMAYFEIENKNYKKAINYLTRSQGFFDLIKSDRSYFTATNEQLLGLSYGHLKDYDKAISHYQKGLESLQLLPQNSLTGLIHNGLAGIAIEHKDKKTAKKHLDLAQKIADESQFLPLKNEIYNTSQKYYALTKEVEKIVEAKNKQDTVVEEMLEKRSTFINESYTQLDQKNDKTEKKSAKKNAIIVFNIILMLLGLTYFVYYRRTQKIKHEKFKQIMKSLEEKLQERHDKTQQSGKGAVATPVREISAPVKDGDGLMMTAETERKIIENLERFERGTLFTDNAISLSSLATYCETNTKYLSYLINHYRQKDFNNYINELRVNFIIEKLKNISKYRRYKISVLAEEAGFSSQNKFATIFKKETAMSPSLFIKFLKEELEEQG